MIFQILILAMSIITFSSAIGFKLLMAGKVEIVTVFRPLQSFPVSAGIGTFNSSFITAPILRLTSDWIATSFSIDFARFLDDRTAVFSAEPKACYGKECLSIYVVGGLLLVSPWPSKMIQLPEADSIVLEGEQILHIDFWETSASNVSDNHCRMWGTAAGALFFCIWSKEDTLLAGNFLRYVVI